MGFPLPESARRHAAWWANQRGGGHTQTAGWRDAGWRTAMLDLNAKRVTFERDKKRDRARTDVAANADFAVQGAIAHLNALGGTMPDYRPAPRDRPMA